MKLIILKDRNNSKSEPKLRLVNEFGNNVCDNLKPNEAQDILKRCNGWDNLMKTIEDQSKMIDKRNVENKELTEQVEKYKKVLEDINSDNELLGNRHQQLVKQALSL